MKVPTRFTPRTQASARALDPLQVQVDPNAFGVGLTRAIAGLGQEMQAAQQRRAAESDVRVNLGLANFQMEQDRVLYEYNRDLQSFSNIDQSYEEQFIEQANAFLDQIEDPAAKRQAFEKLTSIYLGNVGKAQALEQQRNINALNFDLQVQAEQARNIVRTDPTQLDAQAELIADSLEKAHGVLPRQTILEQTRLFLQDLTESSVKGQIDRDPEGMMIQLQTGVVFDGNTQALIHQESGGNPRAVNQLGYAGIYQFGAARLQHIGVYSPSSGENLNKNEWKGRFNIPGYPEVQTFQDFLASPEAQHAAFAVHQQKMDEEIIDNKFDQYIGKYVDGVLITRAGLHNALHLSGVGGTRAFLSGKGNPKDANGTSVRDYVAMGANAAGRVGGLDAILRPDQKEALMNYAQSAWNDQIVMRERMAREAEAQRAASQEQNYAQMQVALARGQLQQTQMVDALERGDISPEQYRTLRSDMQSVSEEGNPEAALLARTLILRGRAGLNDIFDIPGLSISQREDLVNLWDQVSRRGGVLARADVQRELDRIDSVIGGVRGPLAVLDQGVSERLAIALQEATDRMENAPDEARVIADEIIEKYRMSPKEISSIRPPRFFAGNVFDPPEMLKQHVATAMREAQRELQRGGITEEEYEQFLLDADEYLTAIEESGNAGQ